MIQVFKPQITEREIEAVTRVLKSGWLGAGPEVEAFEQEFAQYVGAKYAVAVNSGTAALHMALKALGIGPGDRVIVPTLSFISTALAVSYCGAEVVFADINNETLCMEPSADLSDGEQAGAIIPVHFAGYPIDADWYALAGHTRVVEDCAHGAGAGRNGQHVGTLGDLGCFSFHAVKNMTTGDGGMIVTNRLELVESLRRMRWCGISKDTWARSDGGHKIPRYSWYYEVRDIGWKYQMNDMAAALGRVQLSRLDEMNARRREIAERYTEALDGTETLRGVEGIACPPDHPGHSWHAYIIRTPYRDKLRDYLGEKQIATGVHYMPLHLHPLYRGQRAHLPVAESVWPTLLTLPLYPGLSDADVEYVINNIMDGMEKCRN